MTKAAARAAMLWLISVCCSSAIAQYSIDSAKGVSLLFSNEADGECQFLSDAIGVGQVAKSHGIDGYGGSGYKKVSISSLKSQSIEAQSDAPKGICGVGIEGGISDETAEDFKWAAEHLRFNGQTKINLQLDSPGGLISAAMDIGNIMSRAESGSVAWVPADKQCSSACVLILAAATSRYTGYASGKSRGSIGIHRPFDYEVSSLPSSYSQYLARYDAIMEEMRRYLRKFGVSPQLVDDMSVVPSDDIKYLTLEEQDVYGLGQQNIAQAEYQKAQQISRCGAEFIKKRTAYFNDQNRKRKKACDKLIDDRDYVRCQQKYSFERRPQWIKEGEAACGFYQ
ncbi:ATP-dependent Clp protease proteolytic subunit [Luminiphilus sp.]|nr:ATP-dependent Clp protease proteolytic subunit [Luminiphilus sp.]